METTIYDHYIAIDWPMNYMAIARMAKKPHKITVIDVPSDIGELRIYVKNLRTAKIVAIEETTTTQWLSTELKDYVNTIVICDPLRKRLLTEGPKTDTIDASKLVRLLKANLVKEVYYSTDMFLYLRRLIRGYDDLINSGVCLKNQRHALLGAWGKKTDKDSKPESHGDHFVLKCFDRQIEAYREEKKDYEAEFKRLVKKYPEIRQQKTLPGIGDINALGIASRIVTPYRFINNGHYLS